MAEEDISATYSTAIFSSQGWTRPSTANQGYAAMPSKSKNDWSSGCEESCTPPLNNVLDSADTEAYFPSTDMAKFLAAPTHEAEKAKSPPPPCVALTTETDCFPADSLFHGNNRHGRDCFDGREKCPSGSTSCLGSGQPGSFGITSNRHCESHQEWLPSLFPSPKETIRTKVTEAAPRISGKDKKGSSSSALRATLASKNQLLSPPAARRLTKKDKTERSFALENNMRSVRPIGNAGGNARKRSASVASSTCLSTEETDAAKVLVTAVGDRPENSEQQRNSTFGSPLPKADTSKSPVDFPVQSRHPPKVLGKNRVLSGADPLAKGLAPSSLFRHHQFVGHPSLRIHRLKLPPQLLHLLDVVVAGCEVHASTLPKGWRTDLYSLTRQDIALRQIPPLFNAVTPIVSFIKRALAHMYGAMAVRMDRNQPHVLKYAADEKGEGHTGVELHHDKCDYTVNLMLSRKSSYVGGGTYFPDANKVVRLDYGEFLLHPGNLVHGGVNIKRGSRYLMVVFVNTD